MTETQRKAIATAQRAYLDENWTDYDAFVAEVGWALDIELDKAYQVVENGPIIFS